MRTMLKTFLIPVLLGGLLTACETDPGGRFTHLPPLAGQAVVVGIGAQVIQTKVERQLEVNCSPINLISDGSYCVSNFKPTDRQEVFCFKTLGGVDCYAEPDPYSLEGRALPGPPRVLADPRMPMTPPGRRSNPPQVAVAPVGDSSPLAEPQAQPVAAPPAAIMTEPQTPPGGVPKPM